MSLHDLLRGLRETQSPEVCIEYLKRFAEADLLELRTVPIEGTDDVVPAIVVAPFEPLIVPHRYVAASTADVPFGVSWDDRPGPAYRDSMEPKRLEIGHPYQIRDEIVERLQYVLGPEGEKTSVVTNDSDKTTKLPRQGDPEPDDVSSPDPPPPPRPIDPNGKIEYRKRKLYLDGQVIIDELHPNATRLHAMLTALNDTGFDGETVHIDADEQQIRDGVLRLNKLQPYLKFASKDAKNGGFILEKRDVEDA